VKERSTVLEADGSETIINGLRADLTSRSLWEPQEVAFLDVRVVDSDAASYVSQPAMHALTSAEDEKIRKYHDVCESKGGKTLCVMLPTARLSIGCVCDCSSLLFVLQAWCFVPQRPTIHALSLSRKDPLLCLLGCIETAEESHYFDLDYRLVD
jgi:hypothetical protein